MDGYAVGPPQTLFQAVAKVAKDVHELGLEIRVDKCNCHRFGVDLAAHPDSTATMPLGSAITEDGRMGYGIVVGGIPIGDSTNVEAVLHGKMHSAMSKANNIVTKLRDVHVLSLWTALQYAVQPLFHYWLQH